MSMGTDPEFFILDDKGKPVPAWRHFPPATAKVQASYLGTNAGHYFRDGYALELNTPAESCRGRFGNKLGATLRAALATLPKGYSLTTAATVDIDRHDMADAPPDCQVFGCDASYNAYTEEEFSVDLDAFSHLERYSGGHLHFSSQAPESRTVSGHPVEVKTGSSFISTKADKFKFAKFCDLYIGAPLAYLFDTEDEVRRRKYYGRAGECRLQTYPNKDEGVEYRTPSSKIYNSYNLASMFLGVMRQIVYHYATLAPHWSKSWEKPLQHAINNCEVPVSMLQSVSGFYTPELLQKLKKEYVFKEFTFYKDLGDCHVAFPEFLDAKYTGHTSAYLAYEPMSYGGYGASGKMAVYNPVV